MSTRTRRAELTALAGASALAVPLVLAAATTTASPWRHSHLSCALQSTPIGSLKRTLMLSPASRRKSSKPSAISKGRRTGNLLRPLARRMRSLWRRLPTFFGMRSTCWAASFIAAPRRSRLAFTWKGGPN
jgi:hypothetical protein